MTNRYPRGELVQEVVLAMLAKEPSHGYELRARLREALGPIGEAMNAGQIYVTLGRLEKAGLVAAEREPGLPDRPDRKVYAVTPAGQQRLAGMTEPEGSTAGLLLEGVVLRLQADLRWLEACEQHWAARTTRRK